MNLSLSEQPEKCLAEEVQRFVAESDANRLTMIDHGRIFDDPLVGFADGDDPLFAQYKEIIGDFHWHPRDLLERCAGDEGYAGSLENIGIVSWVIPVMRQTIKSNSTQKQFPSPRWAHARDAGEKFNVLLREHVVEYLRDAGYVAVAPMDSSYWRVVMDERVGVASSWSERHAAYAAGLGTFSLNDALITPKGIAHRLGSVITNIRLEATPRSYESRTANCLFYNSGTCGRCIKRCPSGALSEAGHDKTKCSMYIYQCIEELREPYGIDVTTGCGLCQTGVPCSTRIPKRPSQKRAL